MHILSSALLIFEQPFIAKLSEMGVYRVSTFHSHSLLDLSKAAIPIIELTCVTKLHLPNPLAHLDLTAEFQSDYPSFLLEIPSFDFSEASS